MKVTIVHPAVGKIPGERYLRAWQMEPLPVAQLAALMPKDIAVTFFDDRMEAIDYNHPTDLVAMSVETYTAKRAYQIASEYRRQNVPVVMGGFHATLCPDEVMQYADAVVTGEAEEVWSQVIADFRNGRLKRRYASQACNFSGDILPDRSIFSGKDYVKISLLEAGRGCRFKCEFCSIHNFFQGQHHYRNTEFIVEELNQLKNRSKLHFFVDDNIVSDHNQAINLFNAIAPLKIKWVGQADITISENTELLRSMVESGCQGVLIGFESLNGQNLKRMKKRLLSSIEAIENAIKRIHRAGLRIYATFLFGYENDTPDDFDKVLNFCVRNKFFMVGFNHLTPFPGTELYNRLEKENRLRYHKWWLDPKYTYGQIPFESAVDSQVIEEECRRIRKKFYSLKSIFYRLSNPVHINSIVMFSYFLSINLLLKRDTNQRKQFPLGDLSYSQPLLKTSLNE